MTDAPRQTPTTNPLRRVSEIGLSIVGWGTLLWVIGSLLWRML